MLLHFPADLFPWHGRILFARTEGANWVAFSPDLDHGPQPVDLSFEAYELLERNAPIPARVVVAGIYWFDPLDGGEIRRIRRAARANAALL